MITWKRTPRDFDLSGSSTVQQEIDVSSQPYCYYTDEKIQAQYFDTYVAYSLGEHFWKIEWLRQSGPPPQGDVVYEYKVVVEEVLVEGQEKHKLTASKRSGNPLNITFQPWTLITNDPNVPVNPLYIDPEDQEGPIVWTRPTLVGDRLIIAGSHGEVRAISPYTGRMLGLINLSDGVRVSPITANGTLYILTTGAEAVALR